MERKENNQLTWDRIAITQPGQQRKNKLKNKTNRVSRTHEVITYNLTSCHQSPRRKEKRWGWKSIWRNNGWTFPKTHKTDSRNWVNPKQDKHRDILDKTSSQISETEDKGKYLESNKRNDILPIGEKLFEQQRISPQTIEAKKKRHNIFQLFKELPAWNLISNENILQKWREEKKWKGNQNILRTKKNIKALVTSWTK